MKRNAKSLELVFSFLIAATGTAIAVFLFIPYKYPSKSTLNSYNGIIAGKVRIGGRRKHTYVVLKTDNDEFRLETKYFFNHKLLELKRGMNVTVLSDGNWVYEAVTDGRALSRYADYCNTDARNRAMSGAFSLFLGAIFWLQFGYYVIKRKQLVG